MKLVQLPSHLSQPVSHSYGPNAFSLHGLPAPRPGHVLGLLGANGIGKSTALAVLSGTLKPNLGQLESPPGWAVVVRYHRGCALQPYFAALAEGRLRASVKPQLDGEHVREQLGARLGGAAATVGAVLEDSDERGAAARAIAALKLHDLLTRPLRALSGGELQRLAIAVAFVAAAELYIFDEPSAFLDMRQRLAAAQLIRSLVDVNGTEGEGADGVADAVRRHVVVVEHDLTVLDAVADHVCCLYGEPGAFGVVSKRKGVREGINQFIAGYLRQENVRFRDEPLHFAASNGGNVHGSSCGGAGDKGGIDGTELLSYESTTRVLTASAAEQTGKAGETKDGDDSASATLATATATTAQELPPTFMLHIVGGTLRRGELGVVLGENGAGKSTLLLHLARAARASGAAVAVKPQHYGPPLRRAARAAAGLGSGDGSVRALLEARANAALGTRLYRLLVLVPLGIDALLDAPVGTLSGGQLQRVAIALCLGACGGGDGDGGGGGGAPLFLLDEPSAALDAEQRLRAAAVISRWVRHMHGSALVVEHDLLMAAALGERVLVVRGKPGVECTAAPPTGLAPGLNSFLEQIGVTVRRDPANLRPRVNKSGGNRDREQRAAGEFFVFDAPDED